MAVIVLQQRCMASEISISNRNSNADITDFWERLAYEMFCLKTNKNKIKTNKWALTLHSRNYASRINKSLYDLQFWPLALNLLPQCPHTWQISLKSPR